MSAPYHIRRLEPHEASSAIPALAEVLLDCVAGGASVSFMADMTPQQAADFWTRQVEAADGRAILVAEDDLGVFGVVQVIPAGVPNQPHRADVAKMLVHRRGRRRGVGEALMRAAETEAAAMGKSVLVLDTVTGEAGERLYERVGWTRVGVIPDFALMPDGRLCSTTYFYKALAR